jgi:hypothetical protein
VSWEQPTKGFCHIAKPVMGKPAKAGSDVKRLAIVHQLKLVAKGDSAEADLRAAFPSIRECTSSS